MRKCISILFISIWVNCFVFAEHQNDIRDDHSTIDLQSFAYPLIPDATKVNWNFSLDTFISEGFVSHLESNIWYLASSPFLLPNPYYEVGLTVDYFFLKGDLLQPFIGIGTAFSQTVDEISIPLIIKEGINIYPGKLFRLQAVNMNMIYSEGFLTDLQLLFSVKPFKFGLMFNVGGTASLAYSWSTQLLGSSYGLTAGFSYVF